MEKVAVLGASKKEERYSYKAIKLLNEKGHTVYPIHPGLDEVQGIKVIPTLGDLPETPDTVTLYVNPKRVEESIDTIIKAGPKRVIFNPGTESEAAMEKLKSEGIEVVVGCTLIMLKTDQY